MPTVSVIITLFNKEKYINRAVGSVLAQNFKDFEILIIDDGSTDKSSDIVRDIKDPRIRLIRQANAGVSAARNRGIFEAKADLLAFLDADDEWKPFFLEIVLHLKDHFPQAGIYACAYDVVDVNNMLMPYDFIGIPSGNWEGLIPNFFKCLLRRSPVHSSGVMIPKDVFNHCGMFPVGYTFGEDMDTWIRIALRYPIAFSSINAAIYYRNTGISLCDALKPVEIFPFDHTIRGILSKGELDPESSTYLKEFINLNIIRTATFYVLDAQGTKARERLWGCDTKFFIKNKWMWFLLSFIPVTILKNVLRLNHIFKKALAI